MDSLSSRQKEILDYILRQIQKKGYPPSVREIARAVDLKSPSTVHSHLRSLEEKGYIRRDPSKPRAIEILYTGDGAPLMQKEIINIPVVGRVTAGDPILAVENIEDSFPLPLDYLPQNNDELFILQVKGESMINAGILDGDLVIVRKQSIARDGDIVVALVGDDEATVKRFYIESDHIRLQPENPAMEPIRAREVKVLGKVIGLYRRLE
ncbi:MAG: transcriptional repressor LexA [Halanaerobium sp.]|nr:transcriptional repressor LexA [Halanaerobium sp.]